MLSWGPVLAPVASQARGEFCPCAASVGLRSLLYTGGAQHHDLEGMPGQEARPGGSGHLLESTLPRAAAVAAPSPRGHTFPRPKATVTSPWSPSRSPH